jgi:Ni2+-binding GTPase involved in maturation of urease and hydrogenase
VQSEIRDVSLFGTPGSGKTATLVWFIENKIANKVIAEN